MRSKILSILLIFLFSLIIFQLIISPLKFIITSLLIIILYLFIKYMANDFSYSLNQKVIKFILFINYYNKYFICILLLISSILILFLAPLFDNIYLEWNKINILILIRMFTSVTLTTFIPGFLFLTIIDKKHNLKYIEKCFFSIILSVLFTSLLGIYIF